uniref:Uncharacterized protein n=1 Tax=Arundo donax TaxID=35708 RepID=A0A0A9DAJ8_ARUDO
MTILTKNQIMNRPPPKTNATSMKHTLQLHLWHSHFIFIVYSLCRVIYEIVSNPAPAATSCTLRSQKNTLYSIEGVGTHLRLCT